MAEYTNASHTGLVNLKTGNWDAELFEMLGLALEAAPPIVPTGTVLGPLKGPLAELDAFRDTQIIAPATHDTASAIAGIPARPELGGVHQLGNVVAGGHGDAVRR